MLVSGALWAHICSPAAMRLAWRPRPTACAWVRVTAAGRSIAGGGSGAALPAVRMGCAPAHPPTHPPSLHRHPMALHACVVVRPSLLACRSFLKRQILAYLRTRMGPQGLTAQGKSVVLTVCVQEPEAGDSDAQQSAQAGQPGTSSALHGGPPSAAEAASSESTGESSASESYRAAAQGYSSLHVIDSTVESSANTSTSSDEDEGSGSQHVRRRRRRQLLATAEVSFDPSTRSSQPLLVEPPNCAYLSNMAVRGSARRAGLGSLLVSCAEQIARTLGRRDMYLHLRFKVNHSGIGMGACTCAGRCAALQLGRPCLPRLQRLCVCVHACMHPSLCILQDVHGTVGRGYWENEACQRGVACAYSSMCLSAAACVGAHMVTRLEPHQARTPFMRLPACT